MRNYLSALILLALGSAVAAASGGNVVITGHDDDFHASGCGSASPASAQLSAMISFARAGAPNPSKPVLTFDHRAELTTCLTALGVPFTNIDPDVGVPAASNFNTATYSAIAVASDSTCGGCDNTTTSISNLTAAASFAAFLNAGGGIVAFAGAANASTYYGFLPATASGFGSPPSTGYVQTAFGASVGIPAVNGNATHNFFSNPGTGGVSSAYGIVEINNIVSGNPAETLACQGCTSAILSGGSSTAVPTLTTWMLFATAALLLLMGVALVKKGLVQN